MLFLYKKTLLFLACLLLTHSIAVAQEKIFFEPKSAPGGTQSDFIEYKNIVTFETKTASRFDDYSQIIPTGNYYIVQDYSNKKIILFDKKGKYLKHIKYKEKIGSFRYNEKQNRLEAISQNNMYELGAKDYAQIFEHFDNPKNWKYFRKHYLDLNDTSHLSFHRQQINGLEMMQAEPFFDDLKIISKVTIDKNFEKEEDYELKIFRGDTLVKKYLSYNKRNDSRYIYEDFGINVTSTDRADQKWITRPYDYMVYLLTPDSLHKVYDFILPLDRAIPFDFYTREFKDKTEKNNYKRQNRKLISHFVVNTISNKFLQIRVQTLGYENKGYLFNPKTKVIYDNEKITPDSLTFHLPLLNNRSYNDGNMYFTKITAKTALELMAANKTKNIKYPDELEAYFKALDNNTNPVLIFYNYKN
ncbi:MAG: hypothetical protein WBC06_03660 [Chitinophagaceae bacterium]